MKKTTDIKRRHLILGSLGVSAALPTQWTKPLVNSVLTPAHAQMSPPPPPPDPDPVDPADVCPMIVFGNVTSGPVSGSPMPPTCTVTFDVLSGDASASIDITDITVTMAADTTVEFDGDPSFNGPVTATDANGARITWTGPATNAPFCVPVEPIDDITFTVTATCDAADVDGITNMGMYSQDFTLSDILA